MNCGGEIVVFDVTDTGIGEFKGNTGIIKTDKNKTIITNFINNVREYKALGYKEYKMTLRNARMKEQLEMLDLYTLFGMDEEKELLLDTISSNIYHSSPDEDYYRSQFK